MAEPGFKRTIVGALVLSLLNSPILAAKTLSLPGIDVTAPTITHEPVTGGQPRGAPVVISATVVDDVAVKEVVLFYRPKGESQYRRLIMKPAGGSSLYMATVPGSATIVSNLEYYIKAEDSSGNALLRGGSFSPLVISFESQKTADPKEQTQQAEGSVKKTTSSPMKWVMIGVGILAVGALAASSGGGGGSSSDAGISVTVTTTDPVE